MTSLYERISDLVSKISKIASKSVNEKSFLLLKAANILTK